MLSAGVFQLAQWGTRSQGIDGIVLVPEKSHELVGNVLRRHVARANSGIESVHIWIVQLLSNLLHGAGSKQAVHGQAAALHLSSQGIAPGLEVLFTALLGKPLPHLRLCPR